MDPWTAIETERLALADDLGLLTDEEWDAQSMCAEWKVRHVVAHLVGATTMTTGAGMVGLAKSGFNMNRFMARDAITAAMTMRLGCCWSNSGRRPHRTRRRR